MLLFGFSFYNVISNSVSLSVSGLNLCFFIKKNGKWKKIMKKMNGK